MKISKVFGVVLCLHLGVIAVLIVQPGCRTTQPPTTAYQQNSTVNYTAAPVQTVQPVQSTASRTGLIPAVHAGDSVNSGLNTGGDGRYAPTRPTEEFSEFNDIAPLEPIPVVAVVAVAAPTVHVAGASFETYTVKKGDNLWAIAKRKNITLDELYAANGLNKNSVLKIGQQLKIPVEGGTATVSTVTADTYQPSSFEMSSKTYTVRGGDNLSKIAKQHGTSVRAIKAANNKTSDVIRVGEQLVIPVSGSAPVSVAPVALIALPVVSAASSNGTHVVKAGEYPATIARQYDMTAAELLALNNISDPRKLQVGQVLKVSGSTAPVVVAPVVVAPAPAVVLVPTSNANYVPASASAPGEIQVMQPTGLIEVESSEIDTDALFENAIEVPVIRLEN